MKESTVEEKQVEDRKLKGGRNKAVLFWVPTCSEMTDGRTLRRDDKDTIYKRLHGIRASISSMASSIRSENSSSANSFLQDLQITRVCCQVLFNTTDAPHFGQEIPGNILLNILKIAFLIGSFFK